MKKAAAAALLLAGLFAASLWNIRYLDSLTEELIQQIELSRAYSREENFSAAQAALNDAIDLWDGAEGYTHIFIRHAEVDAASDAFYDVLVELGGGDADTAEGAYDRLEAHIRSIDTMEHITIKSVF